MKDGNEAKMLTMKQAAESKLAEDNSRLNKHLQGLISAKARLEEQNGKLSAQIKDLLEEVASSRAYIDKLLKTSHETKLSDWEKKEAQYKTVIQNLRHQVRKQVPTVSIELYKSAVDGSRTAEAELKRATNKISDLESKIDQLEKEKLETRLQPVAAKTPSTNVDLGNSGFMSPLERGLLGGVSTRETSPWKRSVLFSPKTVNQQASTLAQSAYSIRDTSGTPAESRTKRSIGLEIEHDMDTPLSDSPRRIRRTGLPLAEIKASGSQDDHSPEKENRKALAAKASSIKSTADQPLTNRQGASDISPPFHNQNPISMDSINEDSLDTEMKQSIAALLLKRPDDRLPRDDPPTNRMKVSAPVGAHTRGQKVGETQQSLKKQRNSKSLVKQSSTSLGLEWSHPKATALSERPVEARRMELPLKSFKAFSPVAATTSGKVHQQSPSSVDVNPTTKLHADKLMGMTISFSTENAQGVLAPLAETRQYKDIPKDKKSLSDSAQEKTTVKQDVLEWLDKYNSDTNPVQLLGKQGKASNKPTSASRSRSNGKKVENKKKGSPKNSGSKTNHQKLQAYKEKGSLCSMIKSTNTNGPNKQVFGNSSTPLTTQEKLHRATKPSVTGHGMVLSSTSTNNLPVQKENQKPTKSILKSRAYKVRQMGGRKGLQEMVKKMRSPPPKERSLRVVIRN